MLTIDLTRIQAGTYTAADGRFRIERGALRGCAPKRWWGITDTAYNDRAAFAVDTLGAARRYITRLLDIEAEGGR